MPDGEAAPSPLEEKLNNISSKLTELEDLQLVNKLDIINLKNEIEKLRLTTSAPSPEILERIRELGKIVENAEEFKKLKNVTDNIDKIIADMQAGPEGLEDMIRVVDDIDKRVRSLETQGLGMKQPKEAQEYAKSVKELKSSLESLPKGAKGITDLSKQMEKLRLMAEENAKRIWELSKISKARKVIKIVKPEVKRPLVKKPDKPVVVNCPGCGTALPSRAKFCRKCGAKLK